MKLRCPPIPSEREAHADAHRQRAMLRRHGFGNRGEPERVEHVEREAQSLGHEADETRAGHEAEVERRCFKVDIATGCRMGIAAERRIDVATRAERDPRSRDYVRGRSIRLNGTRFQGSGELDVAHANRRIGFGDFSLVALLGKGAVNLDGQDVGRLCRRTNDATVRARSQRPERRRIVPVVLVAALLAIPGVWGCTGAAGPPDGGGGPANGDGTVVKGGDDRTGPYDPVPGWWKSAPNHDDEWGWGQVAGVAVDNPDRIIVVTRGDWPADRSQPRQGRLRRTNFIVVANGGGEIVEQWTQWDSILTLPHQVYINPYDGERHVWVVDSGGGAGHMQVLKFSNDGSRIVMRLGERDHPKTRAAARARFDWGPHTYGWPSKLAFLPDGSFLLADGYWNSRIVKYTEDGEFIMQWGALGDGPGEFDLLHGLAVDEDRVYVGDRQNERLQLFTHDGHFIEEWPGIFDPVNIWIDRNRAVWVLDGSLNRVLKYDREGRLQDHWGAYGSAGAIGRGTWPGGLSLPHQMDVDEDGDLYIASYSGGWINRFTPKPGALPERLIGARLLLSGDGVY